MGCWLQVPLTLRPRACRRVRQGLASHPSIRRATEMALDCARGMQYLHARKCALPHCLAPILSHVSNSQATCVSTKCVLLR